MSNFINGLKSFMHSLSTNDHYATYDPSKPVAPQEDQAPLTSSDGGANSEPNSRRNSGYVPGMRSMQLGGSRDSSPRGSQDQIPLADMAPIPAPDLSWTRIDDWIESNYPELFDQLQEGATENDLNDLERDLECQLPMDVRESYIVHDGQEHGGKPTGVFFGITLLDIEDISEEWNIWRRAALRLEELANQRQKPAEPTSSTGSTRSASNSRDPSREASLAWIEQQSSCPPEQVQPVYAHPMWIPLAKDFDGNNIAVDLAPGPKGRVGQVILFGRDFDTKYVVSPSWGDFLAQFAADLESGNSFIDDDIEDAVFAFKAPTGQLVSYFNVLKQRVLRTQPRQPQQASAGSSSTTKTSKGHSSPLAGAPLVGGSHNPNPTPHGNRRHAQQPRMNVSVSHAPVNSGRVTQRLTSPNQILRAKDTRRSSKGNLVKDLNEVDLGRSDGETPASSSKSNESKSVKEAKTNVKEAAKTDSSAVIDAKSEVKEEPTNTVAEPSTTTETEDAKPKEEPAEESPKEVAEESPKESTKSTEESTEESPKEEATKAETTPSQESSESAEKEPVSTSDDSAPASS